MRSAKPHLSRRTDAAIPDLRADAAPEAQACIGRIHPDGQEAFDILEREGFETNSYIDLFDAGPTLYARTANIRSIARSQTATVRQQAQIDARDAIW